MTRYAPNFPVSKTLAAIENMKASIKTKIVNVLLLPVALLVAIVVLPFIAVYGIWRFIYDMLLNYRFRNKYASEGKHILFIYSESPNWQEYIENNIVPRIYEETVFLNWSKRSEWKNRTPLEAKALFHWGGDAEFNPMAIVFAPKLKVKTIRFHQAFKDYKYGRNNLLKAKEEELYACLEFHHEASS